jgi:hypothetical protein
MALMPDENLEMQENNHGITNAASLQVRFSTDSIPGAI